MRLVVLADIHGADAVPVTTVVTDADSRLFHLNG
jgi:hypothetical protein